MYNTGSRIIELSEKDQVTPKDKYLHLIHIIWHKKI